MMTGKTVDVFFYGLFMDANLLRQKGLKPQNPRLAKLDGYALNIGARADVIPSQDSTVWGYVMGLTETELDALYSDKSVSAYRPTNVQIELKKGRAISALCYVLSGGDDHETNRPYASSLARLAARLKLPKDYVSHLRSLAKA